MMKKHGVIWVCITGAILVLCLLLISILNVNSLNRVTSDFLGYFNSLITPVGIIVGLVIGYPLLKKKLLENYVSRQFDIMHEANRVLRKRCVELMSKYPSEWISKNLESEYIRQAVADIEVLSSDVFDANPDAIKYLNLLSVSLSEFRNLISMVVSQLTN